MATRHADIVGHGKYTNIHFFCSQIISDTTGKEDEVSEVKLNGESGVNEKYESTTESTPSNNTEEDAGIC